MLEAKTKNGLKCLINKDKITHVIFTDDSVNIYFGNDFVRITLGSYERIKSEINN